MENALIEALDALEAGEEVEPILARYPEHQAELRPILLTASALAGARVAHSLEAQRASRQRFLDYAAATNAAPSPGSSLLLLVRRLSLALATLLIIFALLSTGILFASSEAVPGDALYDAKRFFEDTRFSLTSDVAAREELQQRYQERRVHEIKTLLRMGRTEEVAFTGIIEAMDDDTWQVAGIEVAILNATSISGADGPAVGDLAQVSGQTADGRVNAISIMVRRVRDVPDPAPEPDSVEMVTPEPTATSTPTPEPTATPTPTPTEEVTPAPTSTPEMPENSNANENEGGNVNENGGGNSNENNENATGGDNENEHENENEDDDNENERNENDSNDNDNDHEHENDNDNEAENDNDANENHNDNKNRNGHDSQVG